MTRNWMVTPGADMLYKLSVYKKLTDGVIALQRAELQKVRLEIARERLELLREKRLKKSASSSGPSNETAPESSPASNQTPTPPESSPQVQSPAPPSSPPAPRPTSGGEPSNRRPGLVPPNTLFDLPIGPKTIRPSR